MTKSGDARRTSVLDRATHVASVEGLTGLSFGRLADRTQVPKSALQTLFGTKQDLQLEIVKAAVEVFVRTVLVPVESHPEGLPRLRALMSAWVDYLQVFEGGCIFASGASELDGHPGPVRDALADAVNAGEVLIMRDVKLAIRLGELPPDTDAEQLAFELHAMILQANHDRQLLRRTDALQRARTAIARRLNSDPPAAATSLKGT
ncbi:TetR/AcrR family transcriptional regulator [Mycobacterium sp. pUA109]|uniref:TetR/AcrR family transcriptional regulator n=1 Tax=Mycobacterium sp. pUA109 TaxID=3238982 RepID=UPI00351B58F2